MYRPCQGHYAATAAFLLDRDGENVRGRREECSERLKKEKLKSSRKRDRTAGPRGRHGVVKTAILSGAGPNIIAWRPPCGECRIDGWEIPLISRFRLDKRPAHRWRPLGKGQTVPARRRRDLSSRAARESRGTRSRRLRRGGHGESERGGEHLLTGHISNRLP